MSSLLHLSFKKASVCYNVTEGFKLLFGRGLLNSWVEVFVLQELLAIQSSSGDTDSSLEIFHNLRTALLKRKEKNI